MTKMEYAKTIAELINGEVKTVEKENGIIYTGVTKKVTTNVSPIIYIDNLYENGVDVLDASKKVKEKIEQSNVSFDIDFINDYEKAKPRLQARLYNNKTNVEVSKSAERYGFDDLIIVPILVVSEDDDGTATIKVTRDLLAKWDKSATEVISDAIENLDYEIMDMFELLGINCLFGESTMLVVTNKKRRCGAASVLKAKTEKKKPSNNDLVKTLTSLPANDCNYTLALKKATADDLNIAIKQMKESGGRHSTRIKACESALKKQGLKSEKQSEKKTDCKIYQFPTPDKKPQIYQLKTDGNKTYEECEEKLNKEKETFKDADCQYVLDGLLELAKVDQNFRNNIMREDKTYAGFMEYMFKAAKDGYCIKFGNVGWLDRDLALGLAIDYYNADIEKKKKEEEEKRKKEAEQRKKEVSKNGKTNKKKKGKTA